MINEAFLGFIILCIGLYIGWQINKNILIHNNIGKDELVSLVIETTKLSMDFFKDKITKAQYEDKVLKAINSVLERHHG